MLTVLADDMTGAAEIAGVCLRSGLSVRFDFDFNIQRRPATDVWIIASDTRSLPEQEACHAVRQTAQRLKDLSVKTIFKKIDSALRGHIVPEINVLQDFFPADRILLLPANPESGRIVRNGVYFIDNVPLNQTAFANDPDFPARTASVREILGFAEKDTKYITPDMASLHDYQIHASHIQPGTLPAGGSVFFEACLPVYFPKRKLASAVSEPRPLAKNILMICGSAHENSQSFIRNDRHFPKIEIQRQEVTNYADRFESLIQQAAALFDRHRKLLIAVESGEESATTSTQVKLLLAKITQALLTLCPIQELMLEGGATAYACLRTAGLSSLVPVEEYARGVVRLKVSGKSDRYLTIKPGSYEWPEKIFQS